MPAQTMNAGQRRMSTFGRAGADIVGRAGIRGCRMAREKLPSLQLNGLVVEKLRKVGERRGVANSWAY